MKRTLRVSQGRLLRNKKQRALLVDAQDGKCAICDEPLPQSWHADHVTPWRIRQETNPFMMQALCPKCNLTKGGK